MDWVWFVVTWLLVGLVVGALARAIVPGPQSLGILGTALAGLAGSFVGGIVGWFLFGPLVWWAALAWEVAGAVLLVAPFSVRSSGRRTA